jgi:hypothetical protein
MYACTTYLAVQMQAFSHLFAFDIVAHTFRFLCCAAGTALAHQLHLPKMYSVSDVKKH